MWPTLLVACSSLIIAARAGCSWNSKDEYLNLGVNRGGCFACESLADDADALAEYCRAICLADSSCKSFEIAAGSGAFYFYGTAVNCCIEYADSTDTGSENFWISADDAGTCADEVSLWTTYEPDDIASCELDEELDTTMCVSTGSYQSWEPDSMSYTSNYGEYMAVVMCGLATGCSQAWCTSPDGEGGHDCWAGTMEEECSCSKGAARQTGRDSDSSPKEYEYTCCNDGTGDGPECGDCCSTDGTIITAIIFMILMPCCCIMIGVLICYLSKCCCFQKQVPQQFQQQAAPGYGLQPGITMGQMPLQQGVVQTGVVVGQPQQGPVVMGQPQQGPVVMGQPQQGPVVLGQQPQQEVVMGQPQASQGSVIQAQGTVVRSSQAPQGTVVRIKEVSLAVE